MDEADDTPTLNKAVHALALVPRRNRIEMLGRKAYSAMLWHAQQQAQAQPGLDRFSAPLREIMHTLGGADSIKHVKAHLADMVGTVVEWNSPSGASDDAAYLADKSSKPLNWKVSGLLASAELAKVKGEIWVTWEYSGSLRRELIDPGRYAQINMGVVAQLTTHTAVALYEICARYRNNPGGKTPLHPWQWWGPVLTGTPSEDRVNFEYKVFKRDYLRRAIAQINAMADIEIELIEHKKGRQVQGLQFTVRHKPRPAALPQAQAKPAPADLTLIQRATRLKLPLGEISALLERHDQAQVRHALDALERRQANTAVPPLADALAYLRTVLNNGMATSTVKVPPRVRNPAEPENSASDSPPPDKAVSTVVTVSMGEAVQWVRTERLRQAREKLGSLSDQALAELAAQACTELQERLKDATPVVIKLLVPRIRRLQSDDLRLPRTLNELAEVQAKWMFGAGWETPDAAALQAAVRQLSHLKK